MTPESETLTTIVPFEALTAAARVLRTKGVTPDQLRQAVKDVDEALADIDRRIEERKQYTHYVEAAHAMANDDLEIDDHMILSPTGTGCWVNAWVWIPNPNGDPTP